MPTSATVMHSGRASPTPTAIESPRIRQSSICPTYSAIGARAKPLFIHALGILLGARVIGAAVVAVVIPLRGVAVPRRRSLIGILRRIGVVRAVAGCRRVG